MEHLNNPDVYKPLSDDISNDLKQNIIKKLDLLFKNGLMKRNWVDFCQPPNQTRTSRLYFLKKIHKNPMGIRPIVSSCNSITEPISQFVDKWLQTYVHKLPSYLKDSSQFINVVRILTTNQTKRLLLELTWVLSVDTTDHYRKWFGFWWVCRV